MQSEPGNDEHVQSHQTLKSGTLLSHYRVIGRIGAGGMGEVYRAHDTRLGRDVAIKVLSPRQAQTAEVRARFEREARTISQLNHPHICTLHDVGHENGLDYLVMELVEGGTLADRLEKGLLPVAQVLRLGAEIAEALDVAHRRGIVHRDLKPANVMLTRAGVKLMDFGLARASTISPVAGAEVDSPTMSRPLTEKGTLVGTFQYMAPEQLEGKEADSRSDIWALGCVLYEMATGKLAFEGGSSASLISAIMKDEPRPIIELQPLTPPALDHLVKRCLAKDPAERWQSAHDIMQELEWIAEAGSKAGVPAPAVVHKGLRGRVAWGVAVAALAVASAAVVSTQWLWHAPRSQVARLTILPPLGSTMDIYGPLAAVSPDGTKVVISCRDSAGTGRLWVRAMDSFAEEQLDGTEGASFPFWSPDSRFIAFFAENKLWKIPATGGPREAICDAPDGRGGSWSRNGVIVFAPKGLGPIARVSSDGGEVVVVATPDTARGETALRFPCFLPDGRHFLYTGLPGRQGQFDVYIGDLDSKETRHIMMAESAPVYAEPGYLLFERGRRVVAQRFDQSRMQTTGKAIALADAPPPAGNIGAPVICPPSRSALVLTELKTPNTQLEWLDSAGRRTGTVPLSPGRYEYPSLSPDGRWAAVLRIYSSTRGDIWMIDLQRGLAVPATSDSSAVNAGVWSPDGSRYAYQANPRGAYGIYQVRPGATGQPEEVVHFTEMFAVPLAWSPDGRYLLVTVYGPTQWDLLLLPLEGSAAPVPYLRTPFSEGWTADLSPDGHWVAYSSDETKRNEIYVRSFPDPGERHQVTTNGEAGVVWSRDGKQLLVWAVTDQRVTPAGPVSAIDVQTYPSFKSGTPRPVFNPPRDIVSPPATRDQKHWLAAVEAEGTAPPSFAVILNWQEALK